MTALQGLVLGCLGAPRGSLEMYPEAGRTEGNLSHCDPMRLGRRVLGSGYPKPPPTRPQHSSTLQEQGSKSNYFFKKKKKPKLNLINNLDQGVLSQEPWRHLSRMRGGVVWSPKPLPHLPVQQGHGENGNLYSIVAHG